MLHTVVVGCKRREKERRKRREIVLGSVESKDSKLLFDDLHIDCSSRLLLDLDLDLEREMKIE